MFLIRRIQNYNNIIKSFTRTQIHRRNINQDFISIEINGEVLEFPHVWLRDNCQCEKCFHQTAKSRILDWSKFDVNIKPSDVIKEQNAVKITWVDGHTSRFQYDWLKIRSFTPLHQQQYSENVYKPIKVPWNGEQFEQVCTKHDYSEILNSDDALYNWLYNLSKYGVAVIQNTPKSESSLDIIIEKIGYIKSTHYGIKFIVQNVENTSNVAYLSSNLQMHVDLPYYEYCPGVNMLHCLVQTKSQGGENLLSDCHYVINYMKERHYDQYRLLTEVNVEWSDIGIEKGKEFFKLYRSPVVCLDREGQISRINFSIPQRGSHFPGLIENVKPWYEAHGLFYALNHKFAAKFKTKPGDILVFDNIRLLHGREAYEDSSHNVRKLIGAYVDWDEIYSKLRCLKLKLN